MDESRKQTTSKWIYHGIYNFSCECDVGYEFSPKNCLRPLCKDPYRFTEADF